MNFLDTTTEFCTVQDNLPRKSQHYHHCIGALYVPRLQKHMCTTPFPGWEIVERCTVQNHCVRTQQQSHHFWEGPYDTCLPTPECMTCLPPMEEGHIVRSRSFQRPLKGHRFGGARYASHLRKPWPMRARGQVFVATAGKSWLMMIHEPRIMPVRMIILCYNVCGSYEIFWWTWWTVSTCPLSISSSMLLCISKQKNGQIAGKRGSWFEPFNDSWRSLLDQHLS